jgi:hypothetical protein
MTIKDDKIYLKEAKCPKEAYIIPIISFGSYCIYFVLRELNRENNPWTVRNTIFFVIGGFIIFIIRTIFTDNSSIYADTLKKSIIFEAWNNKNIVNIKYDEVKIIVVLKSSNKKYSIDIYDNELNAYECFNSENYEHIISVAKTLGNEINVKIEENIHILNYEGFKQRKI